ncbi:MAG: hypothetical protein WBB76_04600 [Gaiellaceae bacterium]
MGIGSWWKRLMKREDDAALEHAEERSYETAEERRYTSGDFTGLETDERAARSVREGNIGDVERLAQEDE